jgi:ATP phosphoribosyltransferase regulatory subunit HisZ
LVALAITGLVAQSLGAVALRSTFSRAPVLALAARLATPELTGGRVAQLGESAHLASKLRVATGGRLRIDGFVRGLSEPDWGAYDAIVSDAPLPESLAALGFHAERCGETGGDDWKPREIFELLKANDPAAAIARRTQPYWLAIREAGARH